jgi:type IV pilus assembly protein PilM
MSGAIVGLDIGSVSLRAVELKNADKAKPVVSKFAEVPLPEGSVRRGEVLEIGTVATAIKRLWANGGFSTKDVILGMGGPRVFSRDLTMPKASLAQIRETLPFHVQDLLPVPVSDALLDFYPISEGIGENGPVVHGLLVAAIKEAVTANVAAVTQAGLRPVQVDLIPFALTRALAPIGTPRGLEAVVSIGANTMNVVITDSGVPHFVRIIPNGGDDITRALSTRLEWPVGQAEKVKRELGFAGRIIAEDSRQAGEIIYEIGGEQVNAIRNTLSYYTNSKPGAVLSRVVLSGGASRLPGFAPALQELTGIPVVHSEAIAGAQFAKGNHATDESMTTAFALALGGTA